MIVTAIMKYEVVSLALHTRIDQTDFFSFECE